MKKRTEKQPVDDLFASKLGNMSLPPHPDGFARLQARMGQREPETRVVFWRNPATQRYMAVAACLLLVCLFGWLYLSTETPISGKVTVATNKPAASTEKRHPREQINANPEVEVAATQPTQGQTTANQINSEKVNRSLAERAEPVVSQQIKDNRQFAQINRAKPSSQAARIEVLMKPTEQVAETEMNGPLAELTPEVTDKPALVAERVLIVTIAEPEALLAARQAVKEPISGRDAAAVAENSEKESSKAVNLWQQVKRLKQGEVFARKDADEDERGLLGRAYSGLKQTFDKDKSTKQ